MFRLVPSLRAALASTRQISTTSRLFNEGQNIGANLHRVNNLEKKFLVWTGKYKTVGEVPDMVKCEVVEKARNKMRIRVANGIIVTTLVACLIMSISGKRAHQRGESIQKENLAWHQSHKDEAAK